MERCRTTYRLKFNAGVSHRAECRLSDAHMGSACLNAGFVGHQGGARPAVSGSCGPGALRSSTDWVS